MSWFEPWYWVSYELTEYLPVSSSGHLAVARLCLRYEENLAFTIVVHVATVSIQYVSGLWKEIDWIFRGLFKFQMSGTSMWLISWFPWFRSRIVGVFFKDTVEQIFGSGLLVVGCMLCWRLCWHFRIMQTTRRVRISGRCFYYRSVAQACAVMPGLSRSGSTIATGLLLGNNKARN